MSTLETLYFEAYATAEARLNAVLHRTTPRDDFDRLARMTRPKKTKLLTHEDAAVTKPPVKPCNDCPWARNALPGWLGENTAEEWARMAHGETRAQCHTTKAESGEHHPCAGMAIYRANVGKMPRSPSIQRLPADRELVFASRDEFLEHHTGPLAPPPPRARAVDEDAEEEEDELDLEDE